MFKMFGVGYFIYLILAIAIVLTLIFTLKNLNEKNRKIAQIVIISCMGFFCLLEYIFRLIGVEQLKLGDMLPFEIFDVFLGFVLYEFFSKKNMWKKFQYLIITPISIYSLLFVPNIYCSLQTTSIAIMSFYILNALFVAYGILQMLWSGNELEKKDILDATMNFVIIVAVAHLVNVFLRFTAWGVHANYLGTMGESYDTVIQFLYSLISIPLVCIIPLIAVLVGVEFLAILPFDLIKTKKQKQNQIEELIALGNLKEQQEFRKKHKSSSSQILVRSESKAKPSTEKNANTKESSGFVTTTKQVKVNNSTKENNDNDKK